MVNKIMYKKHIAVLLIMIFSVLISNTSCVFYPSSVDLVNETLHKVVDAIDREDASALIPLISASVHEETDLLRDVQELFDFIQGDIISVSGSATEGVYHEHKEKNHGKRLREIDFPFTLTTEEGRYHVWIKERVMDEFDREKEGILFLCVIAADSWPHDSDYRGNSSVDEGIHITR